LKYDVAEKKMMAFAITNSFAGVSGWFLRIGYVNYLFDLSGYWILIGLFRYWLIQLACLDIGLFVAYSGIGFLELDYTVLMIQSS